MMRTTSSGLLRPVIPALVFLFLVFQQADSVGLSHHQRTARLTTFGNQNAASRNQSTPHQTQISGKECKSDTDCAAIANTTCMRHPDDTKTRCLCGEKKAPMQGSCLHSKQGLHHKCNVDEDCISGATCKAPTNSSNVSRKCQCKEGFVEDDHECNSGILTIPRIEVVFLLLFYPVLQLVH